MTIIYNSLSARLRFLSSVCGLKHLSGARAAGAFVLPLVLGIFLALTGSKAFAQVNTYSFSQNTTTAYTALSSPTVLITASSNTFGNAGFPDDQVYTVSMPFSFMFNGGLYSTVYVSANGFLTFGTAPAGNNYSPISGTAAIAGVLSPWGGDGSGQFNVGGRTSVLSYATLGSAPNRTFVVEWKDWRHAYSTSTTNATYLNFQVRLDETTNIVTYSYGPSGMSIGTTNVNTTRQIGIRGATNADFLNRTNSTTVLWNNSTAGGANSSTQAFSSVNVTPGRPTNPTNYIFTPPAAPTVTAFSPASGCPGTTITIDGTGFTGATAANVQIGGVAVASITSITATQIVAVSGGGNTGAVSVTRAGGTGSSATNFTFDSPPVPGSPSTTALNPGGFTVNWSASAGATSYIIDVSTSNTFATFVTGFNGLDVGNVTSYVVTGLASNTTYYWRARATTACASGNTATQTAVVPCNALTTPATESFAATIPSCWTTPSPGWTFVTADATNGVASPFNGTHFARVDVYNINNASAAMPLTTVPFTVGAGSQSLSYYYFLGALGHTGAVQNPLEVQISTNYGISWTSLFIHNSTNSTLASSNAATNWTQKTIDLSAYSSQTVQFRFIAKSNFGSGTCNIGLDLIEVKNNCSGTPTAGTGETISPTDLACNGSVISLSLGSGFSSSATAIGIGYQWQSSADGISWANIAGATSTTYATPSAVTAATYYRAVVSCSFSGLSANSTDLYVNAPFGTPSVSAFPPQYCGAGGTSVLTGAITGNNPYDTFVWLSPESGVLSNQTNTTADFTITESAAYTYTVTDTTTGCARTVSQSLNVLGGVNPNMVATPAVVCNGGTSVLSSGLSAGNFSYELITPTPSITSVGTQTLVNAGTLTTPLTSGNLDDGGWANVPLGFTFNFFGTNYTTCNVGTNGTVMFGTYNGTALADFGFTTLPSAAEPNPMIAVLAMDNDLTGATGGAIYTRILGFPGNRIFQLTYFNVKEYGDTKFSTAQLKIYEATGNIEVLVTSSTNLDRQKLVGVNGPGGTIGALAFASGDGATAPTINSAGNNPIVTAFAYRFIPPQNYTTAWTPSANISGSASGTNLFSRTTNALTTLGTNSFNLQLTNQQTGCISNAALNLLVVDPPATPVNADITGYGSSLGSASAASSPITICGEQTVTFNYVGSLTAADTVIWWNAATGGSRLGTGLSYTTAALTAGTSVWASINNGACAQSGRYEFVVNYNAAPAVTVNLLGPDAEVNCSATNETFSMTYQLTSSGSYNYTWSNDGNASSAVQSGADYAISSDTLTTSSWSAFEPGTGCIISGQKVFGVYSFPVIVPTVADSLVCIGGSTTLNSNVTTSAFGVKCVPFGFRTAPAGAVDLANNGVRNNSYGGDASLDDGGWDGVPIGFDFNYFGNIFTTVNVGTNGVINFGPYASFNASQYSFPSGFPSTSSPVNTIGVIATDFYMNTTGTVRFWTEGVAPARVFVIEYNGPGWTADGQHVAQAHLFETTGLVEIHVERATGSGTFAGPKTIGLQDGTGTIGSTAPVNCDASGNPSGSVTWNARVGTISASNPQAWRFIPPVSYSFAWTPSGEISGPTTGASAIALPTATVPGTQTYEVTVTDNTSGCVGAPIQVQIELTEPTAQPDVVGWGVVSDVDGTNTVAFCAEQDLNLYVTAGAGYDSTYNAVWYTEAVGGTGFAIAYYDTVSYGVAGPAGISADDTLYVAIDNGICEGPRRMVVLDYQEPDSLVITNSSPINCGPSSLTYTSNISVSSAGAYTYSWSAPVGVLDTNTGTDVVATINNTVNVVLTATDATGFCTVTEVIPVSRFSFPEITPTAANDSICPGGGIQTVLSSNTVAQGFQIIGTPGTGYAPSTYTANTLVSNGATQPLPAGVTNPNTSLDDGYFVVPIGFTFNFLGNDYTQLAISTNGNIQFGPTISTSFTPSFGTATPNNFVALFWTDLDFGSGNGNNSIRYGVSGTAPNRVFSVGFDGCRFGSGGTRRMTGQIDLNETSGIIKLNINEAAAADVAFVSGGDATVAGAENLDGTVGSAIPARTSTVSGGVITNNWSVTTPEGWTMLPPVDYTFNWVDLTSNPTSSIVGTNTQSTVTVAPTATSQYQLIATATNTGCNNATANQAYVTVTIASAPPAVNFSANDVTVTTGGVQQTVTFTTSTPELGGDTYAWSFSPNNVVYVGGTSATSRNPQVQFTEPGAYSATLSMTSCTGTSTFTRPNYVIATAVYCFPYFGDGTGSAFYGCGDGDAVDDVTIVNPNTALTVMAHLNTGCSNNTAVGGSYTDYSGSPVNGVTTATLYQGTTYTMSVSSINPTYNEFFGAWIDVDNDGDFNDPLEFLGGNAVASPSETFEIGIPTSNVIYGLHKMRIMAAFGSGPLNANSACLNGLWGEAHDYVVNIQPPAVLNDIPAFASNLAFSGNQFYPTITTLNGNTSLATNSPETVSNVIGGPDVWVRFIAQSTAVSITMSSTVMDDIIALYSRDAAGNYVLVASENASSGAGDFERLNVAGLTPGTQYWVAFGSNTGAGAFTYSVQHLMRSWCAYTIPAGGFSLCNTFKAVYRGAPSQGVTYKFNFTPTGATGGVATSLAGTNGLINLSNATLALRHGGTYNASVDVTYVLQNSAGANEPINVLGSIADGFCTGVSISAHPLMEVRSNQRCPAVLLRGNYLVGVTVPGSITSFACGAINYTYEFTSVASCVDGTPLAPAVEFTTPAATPYLGLGVLPNIGLSAGAWDVKIRPNFSYGPGNYGPTQRISVNNTAASSMLDEEVAEMDVKVESFIAANLYPNPNNGDMVNLNVSGIESDNVFVRITDAMGRVVYTNRFSVEGSLNTIVTFSEPLASGIYNVEFTVDGEIMTERMIVAKQ